MTAPRRLPRRLASPALLALCVAPLALAVARLVLLPAGDAGPSRPGAPAEARVEATRALAGDPTALAAAALDGGETGDPPARAMALTALARHPDDPRARAALLAATAPDRARADRLVALSVLAGLRGATWAAPALEDLAAREPDRQVRAGARAALARVTRPERRTP